MDITDKITNKKELESSPNNQSTFITTSSSGSNKSSTCTPSRSRSKSRSRPGGKPKPKPNLYLIITNISKQNNIKSLLRTAAAFGCQKIFVAGQRKFNFDHNAIDSDVPNCLKALMADGHLEIFKFDKLVECVNHIKSIGDSDASVDVDADADTRSRTRSRIRILGVEIDEKAIDVEETDDCFVGDTAFMMGNEGDGMNQKQMSLCDGFVKIKQYGGGTASLNVSVAAGIVLHRFHHWANNFD